jgi:GWxTD domain-containing protein
MRRWIAPALLMVGLVTACGPRPWANVRPPHPALANTVPMRARMVYRTMGLMVDTSRLAFVASLRFLAGPTPDSTLAVFALSLANRSLNFLPQGDDFVAQYHVELTFHGDSGGVRQAVQDATVRVHSVQETHRVDESVIFQQLLAVRPGIGTVSVALRDRNGPAYAAALDIVDTVPRLQGPGLGWPIPIYQGTGRGRVAATPQLTVNPRATMQYGSDTLRVYVEGYGLPPGTRLAARVVDADSVELWHDTLALAGDGSLASVQFVIKPGELPLGRGAFHVQARGVPAQVEVPFLVTFSDDPWAVTKFDQMVELLRFFNREDLVAKLKTAPRDQRGASWREFYKASDTVPLTPDNETLKEYFQHLAIANHRFEELGGPGWRTDRGEVFLTLGEPAQAFEVPGRAGPGIRWEYPNLHVTLSFQDDEGFGQYHLTTESRVDYQHALAQVRGTG